MARGRSRNLDNKPPSLLTKIALQEYILDHPYDYPPFSDEVWNRAMDVCVNRESTIAQKRKVDKSGNLVVSDVVKPQELTEKDIVSEYLRVCKLPQYKNLANADIGFREFNEACETDSEIEDEEENETVSTMLDTFFNGYPKEHLAFLRQRLSEYYDNYEFNEGADKLLIVKAVADELEIMRLTKRRANSDVEGRLEKVQKGYLAILDSLKALKKQRDKMDTEGKNKLTLFVAEMEKNNEFKYEFKQEDDIDKMINSFVGHLMRVYKDE